jgi:hypothetical protein
MRDHGKVELEALNHFGQKFLTRWVARKVVQHMTIKYPDG